MEPRRALLLWTGGAGSHDVTWCRWVGALSVCQNKSSGTDGVVITDLGAWRTYDVAVGGPTRDSEPLFAAHFRTRPDKPPLGLNEQFSPKVPVAYGHHSRTVLTSVLL
ncbi:hypothetical protein V5799_032427 [Amblyomma americanum]|uniref:Uncharacterized protein n=1 Tax=Amblyomma americanum TaxID=6943 RepID=A0AAQ4DR74_AMBAM